jgi:GntR family transcriptional regulator
MPWELKSDRPIYSQLLEYLELQIVSGEYQPGSKIPSVRELAAEASVNPNTMQKALAELERTGLVYSQRTSGRYITEDVNMIEKCKKELAQKQIHEFLENMKRLGFQKEETFRLIETVVKERKA